MLHNFLCMASEVKTRFECQSNATGMCVLIFILMFEEATFSQWTRWGNLVF